MTDRDTLRRHADLVDRMASTLGIDLQETAISGNVSSDEISDAVLRCTDCPNPDNCASYLARVHHSGLTPEYCRNQDLFARLTP
ncbi:hypothetical protein FGK63_01585 [Ruegeria sediminis]|uniref:DUF6455 domain-containing protein n=1 Tax=Ruegeria sediminis TaxID=2583820 RepID=A0ABY2X337_9RHOB|nr:DUF6455 family protein [Ruegeria sediminis]TMV09787.1 hypothetical protein FGK63_01585 [Ruegeria sediminis]